MTAQAHVTMEMRPDPEHDSIVVTLADLDTGDTATVQVARVGGSLVVIAAGQVLMDRDARGFARLRVDPDR